MPWYKPISALVFFQFWRLLWCGVAFCYGRGRLFGTGGHAESRISIGRCYDGSNRRHSLGLFRHCKILYSLLLWGQLVFLICPKICLRFNSAHFLQVAMISVVHLSDDVCPGKSHIITQYIRTVQDQPCNLEVGQTLCANRNMSMNATKISPGKETLALSSQQENYTVRLWLQQLYVASSETNAAESESNESGTTDREQTQTRHDDSRESAETAPGSQPASVTTSTDAELQPTQQQTAAEEQYTEENGTKDSCIICQCDQVNVVILPCRHTCVCRECLLRLDKCPMCRSFIQSYFTLDGSAGATAYQPQPPAPDENPANSPRWWVNLNQRVNGFLGFTWHTSAAT